MPLGCSRWIGLARFARQCLHRASALLPLTAPGLFAQLIASLSKTGGAAHSDRWTSIQPRTVSPPGPMTACTSAELLFDPTAARTLEPDRFGSPLQAKRVESSDRSESPVRILRSQYARSRTTERSLLGD